MIFGSDELRFMLPGKEVSNYAFRMKSETMLNTIHIYDKQEGRNYFTVKSGFHITVKTTAVNDAK